jgi:pseudoazurin
MYKDFLRCGLTLACVLAASGGASAADYEVHMLNKGKDGQAMVFEPILTKIAKGDTITFVPTDIGHHVETIKTMIPGGAQAFSGKLNETFKAVFTVEGAYVVKCPPHFGMGMVGVIIVGDGPANIDAIKTGKLSPKSRARVNAALQAAGL